MAFETETEKLFQMYVRQVQMPYVEYGQDFVRFKKEGGKLYEIRVKEIKPKIKSTMIRTMSRHETSGLIVKSKRE